MIVPPCLTIGSSAGQSLHGLIESGVERIAGATGHDHIDRLGDRIDDHAADELDPFQKRRLHVAGDPLERPPLGVDHHVDDEIAAGVAGDPGVFLMDRIALQDAAIGLGMLEEIGTVPNLDRFQRGDAGADQLPPAGKAGHQMRLDQAGRDLQVGLDVAAVDPDRHAARAFAQIRMLAEHGAMMILDPIAVDDFPPDQFDQFVAQIRPMQASGDENGDALRGIPAFPRISSIGSRINRLGTGRVMSEMTMQADFRPRASSASGGVPLGRSSNRRRSPTGSTSGGASLYASLRTIRSPGNSTSKPVRPYSRRQRTGASRKHEVYSSRSVVRKQQISFSARREASSRRSVMSTLTSVRLLPAWFPTGFGAGGGSGGSGLSFSPFLFLLLFLLLHRQFKDSHFRQAQRAAAIGPAV